MGKEEHLHIMIWDLLYPCPQSCQSPAWLWGWFCKCRFTPSWTSSLEAPQGVRVSQRLLLKLSYACRSLGGLSWWLSGNEPSCHAGDTGSVPGSERSPGEGNGNPLHYSRLENYMYRGAWWATVHGGHKRAGYDLATKRQGHLGRWLKCRFWFRGSGVGPETLHF